MTIPLIQRPGPFQQLQQAVQSVMEQRQQRQAQQLAQLLGQTQLQQAQGQVAMQPLQQEQMRAQTAASQTNTQATQGEMSRAETLFQKRQKEDQEVSGALRLLQESDPGSPDYEQRLNAAIAAMPSPEAAQRLGAGIKAHADARASARNEAAARVQAEIDTETNREILGRLTNEPGFRRTWSLLGNDNWVRMEVARMQRDTQGRGENAQADMLTRQLVMGTFADARERFRAAQEAFSGSGEGGRAMPYWFYQPDGRAVYIDPNVVTNLTPFRPREQNYILGALEALSQSLGIPRAQVETMVREWVTRPRGNTSRPGS